MKTHLDLFSGIGGFALAARWAGIETVQFCELDPFCQKVLAKNFPGVPIHNDIKTFKYSTNHTKNDVLSSPFLLTGGFPCQPFSCAGKRRGKEDDRFLWPEMLRVVSEAKPTWVIGENVAGFINMGLDDCISDLENQGYEVQAFIIPACAVGAPHRRDRVWIVGHTGQRSGDEGRDNQDRAEAKRGDKADQFKRSSQTDRHAPDTNRFNGNDARYGAGEISQFQEAEISGCNSSDSISEGLEIGKMLGRNLRKKCPPPIGNPWQEYWLEVATRLCRVDDGIPRQVDRVNRLKALGNAIIPQVAYEIMRAILEVDNA